MSATLTDRRILSGDASHRHAAPRRITTACSRTGSRCSTSTSASSSSPTGTRSPPTTIAPRTSQTNVFEMVIDWLASRHRSRRGRRSSCSRWVPEHAELHLLLSMITPLGWLERVPTYKEQQQQLADRDLSTYGFLGYPGAAGRRHPDLPRHHRAGRRGPGAARRADARDRAPLQPHLRPRARVRGKGRSGGQEAWRKRRQAVSAAAHALSGAGRCRGPGGRARADRGARRICRSAIASGCSAISKAAAG